MDSASVIFSSRQPRTDQEYARKFSQLEGQTRRTHGYNDRFDLLPIQIVQHLISRRASLAKRTWQVYKRAICIGLEQHADSCDDPAFRQECWHAIAVLTQETQSEALPRGTRTSSLKAKHVTSTDHERFKAYLTERIGRDKYALTLKTWCEASLLTGLRPCEWGGTWITEEDGKILLAVQNSKATFGLGDRVTRHLNLSSLSQTQLDPIYDMISIVEAQASEPEETFADLQKHVSDYMYRAIRVALKKRRHYPSLDSYRRQFSADAKERYLQIEVEALTGHRSDATAGGSYVRSRKGS